MAIVASKYFTHFLCECVCESVCVSLTALVIAREWGGYARQLALTTKDSVDNPAQRGDAVKY